MKKRKVGIVGVGHVGAHTAYSIAMQGSADEIVLVDINDARLTSEHQDLLDASANMPNRVQIRKGSYEDLRDCDVVVNSAGDISLLMGEDRSLELKYTVPAVHTWAEDLGRSGFEGVILSISNPCDVVAHEIALASGLPKGRVLGTGTGLDSARLIAQTAKALQVSPQSVQAFILGEHGVTQFAAWSCASLGGMPLDIFLKKNGREDFDKENVEQLGCHAGIITFSYKHATEYGIAAVAARMVRAIIRDEQVLLPASVQLDGEYGQRGLFAGVPVILGKNGVEEVVELPLTEDELSRFGECCDAIRANMRTADQIMNRG